jgi:CheY-like chemotaxis protein
MPLLARVQLPSSLVPELTVGRSGTGMDSRVESSRKRTVCTGSGHYGRAARVVRMPITLHLIDGKPEKPVKGAKRPSPKEKEAFSPDAPPPLPAPASIGKNRRILVVDDNPVVLKAFEMKLKADGFEVITSTNSASVASTVEQSRAEIVVLDVNFPGGAAMEWSGFTVVQWLRRFPELARLPVILISGTDNAEYREKALASGAVAFFQKPVVYAQILEVILKSLPQIPPQLAR